jgi:hypothetical protein
MTISLILLVLAFICFVVAAMSIPTGRVQLVALGLAFCVLSEMIGGGHLVMR